MFLAGLGWRCGEAPFLRGGSRRCRLLGSVIFCNPSRDKAVIWDMPITGDPQTGIGYSHDS